MSKGYTLEELKKMYEDINNPEQVEQFVKWSCFPVEPITRYHSKVKVEFFKGDYKGYLGEVSLHTLHQKRRQAELSSKRGKRELRLDNLMPKERVRFVKDTLESYGYEVLSMPKDSIRALTKITIIGVTGAIRETNWNSLQKTIAHRTSIRETKDLFTSRKNNSKVIVEWADKHNVQLNKEYVNYNHIYTGTVLEGQYKGLTIAVKWLKMQNDTPVQFSNLTKESKIHYIEKLLTSNEATILKIDEVNESVTFLTKYNNRLTLGFGAIASKYKRKK